MYRIIILLSILFLVKSNLVAQKTAAIHAERIMLGIKTSSKAQVPLTSFLVVCDSIFKKNGIAKMAITLSDDYLDSNDLLPKEYEAQVKQFKPDAFIALFPFGSTRIMNRTIVTFDAYLLPIEPIDYEFLPINSDNTSTESNEIFIGNVSLTTFASLERSQENGIKNAQKFIEELKKHISNLK
jgi:hypothetical protein